MKESLIPLLISPVSKEPLVLVNLSRDPDGEIMEGILRSPSGEEFPIVRGVPRFVGNESYVTTFGIQWNRFSRTQLDSAYGGSESHDVFFEKTGWSAENLKGCSVLEGGCGMGRFLEVAAGHASTVVGVDMSQAVDAAFANLRAKPHVHIVQADIFSLPFREQAFSRIYSLGVLHHTPDPPRAFRALVPLLEKGGEISVWVYGKKIRNSLALFISDSFRLVTTRLPASLLLKLAWCAIPLGYIHQVPLLGPLVSTLLPVSNHGNPAWRWLDTFDWYSPRYQFKYSEEEVRRWFDPELFETVRSLPVPVSLLGKRKEL
jgi:SAM-dependent methyltransferase